ncbi:MAG: 50S ribosome-binding GTPase, partial [Helicobacter sp.]|nr:50S ribosome-binding GTPase [Helicobacter sp.]
MKEEKEIELKVNWNQVLVEASRVYNEIKSQNQQPRLNILVLGKTGVGKSTLINTVFGKDFTKTGQGNPVTQEIESFTDNERLFIYDSPGLELDEAKKIQIENFIKEQEAKAADEQIHIAWLCINEAGRRIEQTEKALYRLLKSHRIPILAVITKAQQDKDEKGEKFSDVVKKELESDEVFRVRALEIEDDDGEKKKIMGIKELINKSYILLPDGRKEAFARKQQYDKQMRKEQCVKDAKSLINYYSTAAAVPCASPLPFSDIVLILPIQIAMILDISKTCGLEFN